MAPARDGAQVPVSILMRKGAAIDGAEPAAAVRLRLVRRDHRADLQLERAQPRRPRLRSTRSRTSAAGRRWAAHWYDDGKMMKKKNTFYDFIDVAE